MREATTESAQALMQFWFEEIGPRRWFVKDPELDQTLRRRFEDCTSRALAGELAGWAEDPGPGLALMLLLDQFPRQIWRDQARAFAGDPQALQLSLSAHERGWIAAEADPRKRCFWLMPRMHCEDLSVQEAAIPLFERYTDPITANHARRHRDVIAHFGRFPHRNQALGRSSTAAEEAFLAQPGSRF